MASKSKSRRRVFRASCILAALIVAGSSFAWFTSKDEVTNRLSASGDYDVTIAEDFTPPEKWLPGQKVDKNVGAVNTGTIDAFVRMWLEGEMKVLNEKRDTQKFKEAEKKFTDGTNDTLFLTDTVSDEGVINAGAKVIKETDEDLIAKNLTYYYQTDANDIYSKVSLKELDNTNLYNNPNSPITTVSSPDGYTEVMALQAGGELACVKTKDGKFEFTFKPNQTQTVVSAGYDTITGTAPNQVTTHTGGTRYDILGGTEYTVKVGEALTGTNAGDDIEVNSTTINVKDLATFYKYLGGNIDTNTFEPKTTGLYIFKRNSDLKTGTYEDSEYTGYYYVATDSDTGADGKFFALQYENDGSTKSNYVLDKDTYSITRDAAGNVTFVPYRENGSYKTSTNATAVQAVKVGDDYYDATTGKKLTSTEAGAQWTAGDTTKNKSVTLYTAKTNVIENDKLTWKYNSAPVAVGDEIEDNGLVYTYKTVSSVTGWYYIDPADNVEKMVTADSDLDKRLDAAGANRATLTATYYGAENDAVLDGTKNTTEADPAEPEYQDKSDDISVVVNLNNVNDNVAEAWTAIKATGNNRTAAISPSVSSDAWGVAGSDKVTFYYNNDVEEGASTRKLVDSVELSSATEKNAYLGFDFDLNVNMNSIQITIDDNGKEAFETVNNPAWAGAVGEATPATGAHRADPAQSGTEIDKITWAQYNTP